MWNGNSRLSKSMMVHAAENTRCILMVLLVAMMLVVASCTDASENATPTQPPGEGATESSGINEENEERLNVIVSLPFFPSMVDAVGGDKVSVQSLVPQGVDTHTYQPTPRDAQAIADADIILVNGHQLEEWMSPLIESAGGVDAPVYELSESLDALEHADENEAHGHDEDSEEGDHDHEEGEHEHEEGEHEHEEDHHDHEHNEGDPHFWLDPQYGVHYVQRIAEVLTERDSANAALYQENADSYIDEIEELDRWAEDEFASIPAENRKLVTFHESLAYFADRYDFEVVGVIIRSPGREPGAQEIARLVEEIQTEGVPAIFIEPQFNPRLAETLSEEAGVRTQMIYTDSPPENVGYLEMMRLNVESIVEGLSN